MPFAIPSMFRFERDGLEDQKGQRCLDQTVWLCHTMVIYNKPLSSVKVCVPGKPKASTEA
jgi:hypothetical protein